MELDDFRIFLAVVRRGTLTGAGEEVHLSQPAITRRLQGMERRTGARLFERDGRRLRLTDAGRHLQRQAEAILMQVADLASELSAYAAGSRGALRIGATVTSCIYLLPPVFARFRTAQPGVQVIVRNDASSRMSDLVRERRIDVGIASVLVPGEGVRAIPWRQLDLALVRPAEWRDSPKSLAEAGRSPVVLPTAGTLRTLIEGLFARGEIAPPVAAECDSLEVVRSLVASGFGQAILPRVCLCPDEPGLREVELRDPLPPLPVAALVARTRRPPAPVAAFLEALGAR
jgi:LysR family carnitine catabolism transcriptional activator